MVKPKQQMNPLVKTILHKKHFMLLTYEILQFLKKERKQELEKLKKMYQAKLSVKEVEQKFGQHQSVFTYNTFPALVSRYHIREYMRFLYQMEVLSFSGRPHKAAVFIILWFKFWIVFIPHEQDLKERLETLGLITVE